MKKIIALMLIISLVLSSVCLSFALDYDNFTRGDFFELVAKTLLLEGEESALEDFPDYDGNLPLINAMINKGYLLGRTDGTLSLDKELCLADVEYLFSRFDLTPKIEEITVEKTKRDIVPVPVPLPVPIAIPVGKQEKKHDINDPEAEHLYQLQNNKYVCECEAEAAVGVYVLPLLDTDYLDPETAWDSIENSAILGSGSFDAVHGVFNNDEDGSEYPIAANAICFDDGESIGYAEMFRKYAGQEIVVEMVLSNEYAEDYPKEDGFPPMVKAINIVDAAEEAEGNLLWRLFRW